MKLIQKYYRLNILATITVLLVGGLCYFSIIRFVLIHQLDRDLKVEEQEIREYIRLKGSLPAAANYKDQKTVFAAADSNFSIHHIQSIDFYNAAEKETSPSRQLIFNVSNNGKNYRVSISKSEAETEDLVELIAMVTMAIVALLLLVLFLIKRFAFKKLWVPFNSTLQELKLFNVHANGSLNLKETGIEEFNELNSAVSVMSSRVLQDYNALKTFTENASHEIQTPLAIIKSKLELLIQAENFDTQQIKDVEAMGDAIHRLSKLNQSLLLLTKIDNWQFLETENVNIANIIVRQLTNYSELIEAKCISLYVDIKENTTVVMNSTMADVLLSNLITNAIKHNIDKGTIEIILIPNQLKISNTGLPLNSHPDELFERFKKDTVNAESLGLGLSIVQKICDRYDFKVQYTFEDGIHTLWVHFP